MKRYAALLFLLTLPLACNPRPEKNPAIAPYLGYWSDSYRQAVIRISHTNGIIFGKNGASIDLISQFTGSNVILMENGWTVEYYANFIPAEIAVQVLELGERLSYYTLSSTTNDILTGERHNVWYIDYQIKTLPDGSTNRYQLVNIDSNISSPVQWQKLSNL